MNKNLVICRLDEGATLNMELSAGGSRIKSGMTRRKWGPSITFMALFA
jgi:DNA-directed RNA polymerase alpha subunit